MIHFRDSIYINPTSIEAVRLETQGMSYYVDIYSTGGIVYHGVTTESKDEAMSQLEMIASEVDGLTKKESVPLWYQHG